MQALTTANKYPALLFSAELFLDTRLSQQLTGGVLLHIEDWLAGVQRSSRQKKTLKRQINQNNTFMQNKPNFKITEMNSNPYLTMDYRNETPLRQPQNKPNQTQSNPISNQPRPLQALFVFHLSTPPL
ncbi:MAG: hypothetical protein ACYSR8_06135 [Planctomycetota bacterium]|jgi:hypothetical protein